MCVEWKVIVFWIRCSSDNETLHCCTVLVCLSTLQNSGPPDLHKIPVCTQSSFILTEAEPQQHSSLLQMPPLVIDCRKYPLAVFSIWEINLLAYGLIILTHIIAGDSWVFVQKICFYACDKFIWLKAERFKYKDRHTNTNMLHF